jgi:hypothetical protein
VKTTALTCYPLALITAWVLSPCAASALDDWQVERLLTPTWAQQTQDARLKVFIYDGLTDRTVERAMDEQFARIDAMMFTRVVVTDTQGAPVKDPETGEVVVEEDGCD